MSLKPENAAIVFVDSKCVVCNGLVEWILARDRNKSFLFAGLNSDHFQNLKESKSLSDVPDTVILYQDEVLFYRSEAVLRIFRLLGAPWSLLAGLSSLIPVKWRDSIYDWVARNRYGWFGQMDQDYCKMPEPKYRDRFLG